jgi:cytochrome P450
VSALPDRTVDPRKSPTYHFDRHSADYRGRFLDVTHEMQRQCPIAWTDTYDGHWVAAGGHEVFELARCPHVSNDHDVHNVRRGYKGISIPMTLDAENFRGGMLEMDDPEHRYYRTALNPYLSPAAVKRWEPFVDEITRACIDDHIEAGHIDFVDDLANVVPAVLTLAMLGYLLRSGRSTTSLRMRWCTRGPTRPRLHVCASCAWRWASTCSPISLTSANNRVRASSTPWQDCGSMMSRHPTSS